MAFSKPTDLPEWAADGTNTVEPSEGEKDTGWIVDEIPPSSYENWIQRTNWLWWRWWDEKVSEGTSYEKLNFDIQIDIRTPLLPGANYYGLWAFAKGDYPGLIGTSANAYLDLGVVEKVGVVGLMGSGNSSGVFTDVGVLGCSGPLTTNLTNVGVAGHSTSDIGVVGLVNNADISGGTLNDVGVAGIIGTYTGSTGGAGVFGYATWGVHGQGTQQGVRGEGTSAGAEGGVFIANSGGDAIIATGDTTGGSGISAGRGIWSTGSDGTGTGGAGIYSIGGDGVTNGNGGAGAVCVGGSGAGTGSDGPPLRLVPQAALPAVGDSTQGDLVVLSATGDLYIFNGTAWAVVGTQT
jgi:hypothetical protein